MEIRVKIVHYEYLKINNIKNQLYFVNIFSKCPSSFYLKGIDSYLLTDFQRKNESCQKCLFGNIWQRTFYFLHIL